MRQKFTDDPARPPGRRHVAKGEATLERPDDVEGIVLDVVGDHELRRPATSRNMGR